MSGGAGQLVTNGPLILAVPVVAVAGAITFASPCCLPLIPGYLSYLTGMSGAGVASTAQDAQEPAGGAGIAAGPARAQGRTVAVRTTCARPAPLPLPETAAVPAELPAAPAVPRRRQLAAARLRWRRCLPET